MKKRGTPLEKQFDDLRWYRTFISDVVSQLPGPNEIPRATALKWHADREQMHDHLRRFVGPPVDKFPLWMTLRLGTHTVEELRMVAPEASLAFQMMQSDKFTVAQHPAKVDLVLVSPDALGVKKYTPEEFIRRALEVGLKECPPEVGPQLHLQWKPTRLEKELMNKIVVGMQPVELEGRRKLFKVAAPPAPLPGNYLQTIEEDSRGLLIPNPHNPWLLAFIKPRGHK